MGAPGLAIFALLMFAAMLVLVGAGIVLTMIVVLAMGGLVSAGIISSSLIVGLKTRSVAQGMRLAIFQISAVFGAVCGLGIAAGLKLFMHPSLGWATVESLGLLCGGGIGMAVGYSLNALMKMLQQRWMSTPVFDGIQPVEPLARS